MRWSLPWQKRSKSQGKDSRKKARELRIETLEDKVLLAVDTWVGGGSNNHWSNAANWQAGVAPSAGDQLIFQGTALTATQNDFTAGTSFQSLEFQSNNFSIAGNSFTVTGSITTDSGVSGTSISAPLALNGAVTVSVAGSNSLSLSGAVSGSGSLTTTASGKLSLAAANSYSGGTTLDAGMVSFVSGGLGSSGTITLGGTSTLQWAGSNTQDISSRLALANAASATLDVQSNTVTLATGFGGSSTASLTKAGSGTLILTGSDGYSGGTTINSGTLQVGNPPSQMTGSLGSGPIVDNGALAIDVSGTTTIAGVISGTGTLSQSSSMMNSNTLVLTGTNTFSGAVSVGSYCTLQVGSGGSSGTLGSGGVSGSGTLTFDSGSTQTVSNTLSGGLALTQEGSGALVLTGSNSYTGSTTVNSGSTLRLGGSSVLPDGSSAVAATVNGTLDLNGYSPTLPGLSGSGTVTTSVSGLATLSVGNTNLSSTFSGVIQDGSGQLALTKAGTGTLILTGNNTFSGGTTINSGGSLQLGNPPSQMTGSLGSGPIVDNGTLAIDVSGTTTVAGAISGSGGLTQSGYMMSGGTLVLTGTNTFSGAVSVGSYCTLQVGSGGAAGTLGSGGVSGSGTLVFDLSSTLSVSNTLSGGLNLTQEGSGALVLTGSNSYTGNTTIDSASTLRLGGASVLPDGSGAVAPTVNGTLDLNGYSPTLPGLSGSGTVTTSVAGLATLSVGNTNLSCTFGGVIQNGSGQLALTKTGTGTLTITGSNTYSGTTTISSGTLQLGNPPSQMTGSLGSGPVVDNGALNVEVSGTTTIAGAISGSGTLTQSSYMMSSGTLVLTGSNSFSGAVSVGSNCTLQVGSGGTGGTLGSGGVSGSGTVVFDLSSTLTVGSALSSSLALTVEGTGVVVLTGSNTYSGNTVIDSGATLQVGSGGTAGTLGTSGVSGSGTLAFNRSDSPTIANTLSGSLSLAQQGTGILILTAGNSFTGTTTVNSGGTLQVGAGGTAGTLGSGGVSGAGTLVFDRSDSPTVGNALSGSLSLTQAGSGVLLLTGSSNSFSGATTVNSGGTLRLGGAGVLPNASGDGTVTVNGTLDLNGYSPTLAGLAGSGTVTSSATGSLTLSAGSNNQPSTFSGVIQNGSSTLALTKVGSGTLVLTGTNTFSQGTAVSSGTLQVGAGGTAGTLGSGGVSGAGTLAFDRSDSPTIGNTLSGSLSLAQEGSGILVLGGTNSFTGAITINVGGTLQVGGNAALPNGAGTAGITVNGTLDLAGYSPSVGSLAGGGTVTSSVAGTATLGVGANNQSTTFSGLVEDGAGSVTLAKTGTGTLTLGGSGLSFSGGTIAQGTLVIENGLTLNGTLTNDATLSFLGSQALAGSGEVTLGNSSDVLWVQGTSQSDPATLTVGPEMTIHGSGSIDGYYSQDNLVNQGTILADAPYLTLAVDLPVVNEGTLASAGTGVLSLENSVVPLVTVSATTATAYEAGCTPGEFTVTRSGDTTDALGVGYSVTGSGVSGTDYSGLPDFDSSTGQGLLVIPAGASQAEISITPIDEQIYGGSKTVTLALGQSAGYQIGDGSDTVTIQENDVEPALTLAATTATAYEYGQTPGQFTLTRNGDTAPALTVTYALAAGTGDALSGTDFTGLPNFNASTGQGWITIPAGASQAQITVTPIDEQLQSGSKAVTLTLGEPSGYEVGTPDSDTVTIEENDPMPAATIVASTATAYEFDEVPGQFTVTRTGSTAAAMTVAYTVATGTGEAVPGTDYESVCNMMDWGSVTIPAGASQAEITITPVDEQIFGGTKAVTLSLTTEMMGGGSAGYQLGDDASDTVVIEENDVAPVVTIVATTPTAYESGQIPGQFTVTRTGSTVAAMTVAYDVATGSGEAVPGTDYTGLSTMMDYGTLTIPAGASQAEITITPVDEQIFGGTKAVTLSLTTEMMGGGSAGYQLGDAASDTVVIEENDVAPVVTIVATTPTAYESGQIPGQFTVTRTGSTVAAMTVAYDVATGSGEAVPGTDYTGLSTMMDYGTLTIPAGASQAEITITPIDEQIFGGTKAVTLSLTTEMMGGGSAGYQLGDAASDTVTIQENDVAPVVTITASAATLSESQETPSVFTISAASPVTTALTVYYTVSGTGVAGTDYTGLPNYEPMMNGGSVTIAAGSQTAQFTLTPIDEGLFSGSETATVTLATSGMGGMEGNGPAFVIGTPGSAGVTIENDDVAPVVSITASPTTLSESEQTPGVFTIARTGGTNAALTVYYTVSGTAAEGTDFTGLPNYEAMMNSGSVTIPAGSVSTQLTITPVNNDLGSGSETVTLTLAPSDPMTAPDEGSGATFEIGSAASATMTIENDAVPPTVTIAADPATLSESEQTPGVFTVSADSAVSSALTVYYDVSGTAVEGTDYTGLPNYYPWEQCGSVVIAQGAASAQITITPANEDLTSGSKTVTLSLATDDLMTAGTGSQAAFNLGTPDSATATIEDDYTAVTYPPTAAAQDVTVIAGNSLAITLTASDPQAGRTLTYSITAEPSNGTLSGFNAATGQVVYTPASGYAGTDAFSFIATDNGSPPLASDPATVTITVAAEQPPVVSDSALPMVENNTLNITPADFAADFSDPNAGDTLQAVQITALPQQGTLYWTDPATGHVTYVSSVPCTLSPVPSTLTYQPPAGYTGSDSFQWNGSDGQAYAATPATMTVNIAAEQAPVVSNGSLSMVENQTLSLTTADFTANYSDANVNDPLQVVEIIALPQQGTLAMCGEAVAAGQIMSAADLNELTYQPAANYTGPDAFTWNGCDGQLYAASSAALDIDVAPDKAPVVTGSATSVVENESLSFTAADFTANFSDPVQGNTLQAVQITTLPQHGTLVLVTEAVTAGEVIAENELGNLTYQPNANYTGPDSFQWNASDGQLYAAAPATLGITVTVDVPPVVSDSDTSVAENSSLMFTSADFTDNFTDAEPNAALGDVQITTLPQQGMLALSGTAVTAGQVIAAADLVDLTYAPATDYSGPDSFQWNASDGQVYAAAPATMNITVEPTAAAGTDGNTLASGDEAFQLAVDAGIDAVDQALTGSADGSGTLDTLQIGTFTPLAEEGCGFSPNLDSTTVPTSQSYSGTLPIDVTVATAGGGYTISDSVTAVYSMQVSGDATSGTFTLNVSIQATTGYNESENAAGAATPWTIEEPGSYQLSFQSGGSYAVVGGVVSYTGTYTSQESGSNYPVTDENGAQTSSTSSDTWTWHDPGQTSFTSNESAGLGGAGASGTYSSSENSSDTPSYSETDTSDTPDDATDWSGSDTSNSTYLQGGQSHSYYSDSGSFTPAGSTGTYQLSLSDNEKYTVTETDSENDNYADGAGTTETDTCTESDPGSGYDNFSFNIIMSYSPSGYSGLYKTSDGTGGVDDYSGSGTDGDDYTSSTITDGITVPWQMTCDTNSNSSYNEGGMINPAGDTGAFQTSGGCTETIVLSDSVTFTGSDQVSDDTQTDTSKYQETDHETQPETYTESCVFGPNGCSGTYKSGDPVTWHDTYSGSDQFNDNWQDTNQPYAACPYPTSGSYSNHDSYTGSDDAYPSDSNTGTFTQAGSTGLSKDTDKWDGTESYDSSDGDNYATPSGTDTASGNMSSTDDGTFNYNGDDSDADSYTAAGGWGIQTGYDEVENSTDTYHTQGENQSSCPADSLSGSVDTTTTDSNDQQWHDSGAVGPAGSTSTTEESDDGTTDMTWDNSDTDTYNEYLPMLGGWVAGTPETTTEDGSFDVTFDDPAPVTVTVGTPPATPITMPVAADALSADRIQTLLASLQTAETTAQQDPTQLAAATDGAIAAFTAVDADANGQNGGAVYAAISGGNTFDSGGRVTTLSDANGGATTFTYDSAGNLASLTDPDGNTTTWTYNSQDQLIQETNPLGASAYYSYDSAGDLTSYTDYDGRVRQFTYDANHDLLSETWYADTADADAGQNAEDVFQYAYNSAGQIVSESSTSYNAVGGELQSPIPNPQSLSSYTYDSQGRETSVTESSTGGPTVVLSYQYTGTGTEPSVVSASIDGTPDYQDTYQYDSQGDVTQVTQTGQSGGDAVADVQVDLTYNPAGQPQTVTRYVGGQLAVTASYSYDSDDNLTGLVYSQGGTTLAQYAWTYTNAGVPASAGVGSTGSAELNWTPGSNVILPPTDPSQVPLDLLSGSTSPTNLIASATSVDGTANYSYDPAGQLTGATYSPLPSGEGQGEGTQPDESYSYDSNGNRTNTGYVTGPDNELLSDGTYNYSYDADGNRIERTNIATGAVTDYVWDNRDRLVEVIDRASAGGAITQDVHYTYDAENRWIGETVSIPGQAVQETSYAYCGNQIVLQFDGTSSTSALGLANLSHRYLWGPAVDQILAGEQVTSLTQPGNVVLPLTNNEGTVCDLAQYNPGTGTTSVVDHRVYDSFGNLVSQTNAAVDFLFGCDGRPTDGATGWINDLNRWDDPRVARWASLDPTGFDAGDTNVYRYVGNNPTNASDPSGLGLWGWIWTGQWNPSDAGYQAAMEGGGQYALEQGIPLAQAELDVVSNVPVAGQLATATSAGLDALAGNYGDAGKKAAALAAGKLLNKLGRAGKVSSKLGAAGGSVARWEKDLERGSKIATEMAKRGYTKKQIAEWLAANSARALGRMQRMNDGLSDTLPQYPAPWQ